LIKRNLVLKKLKLKVMKKNLLLSLSVMLCFTIISCNKATNTTNNNTPPAVTNSFTANVNGAWTATNVTGSVYSSDYINVKGVATDGSYLQVTMPIAIAAGTYNIGAGTQITVAYTASGSGYSGANGTLVISSNSNNVIKGSWSGTDLTGFTASVATIYSTSGTFVAKYR
jgi:hypothetical protein